jgi:DDE superfamily endonuclease
MDETGYRTGCGRAHWIVTTNPRDRQWLQDSDNRIHISFIECISATGFVVPSAIILPGKQVTHDFIVPELDGKTLLAITESGYSNDEIQIEWIRHFNKHTKARTKGAKRPLLCDGYKSHLDYDFVEYCWDENIIPFAFIPHTTHVAQPLDVKVFQPVKHYHSEAIDSAVRTGDNDFSKTEFLVSFSKFHKQAFKESTILSSFRETGIVPWNPDKVLLKIPRPQTPPRALNSCSNPFQTPDQPKQLVVYGRFIQALLEQNSELPGNVSRGARRFIKGALARNASAQLTEKLLETTQLAEENRQSRKQVTKRVIQKGGVIEIQEARKQIQWARNYNYDALKQRHKLIRKRHRKRQQTLMKELTKFAETP